MGDHTSRAQASPGSGLGVGADEPLFAISVVTQLTGVNGPMLRVYESKGLVTPARTAGGTRRYSENDVAIVRRITTLLAAGLNLAGARAVLDLEAETRRLRDEIDVLHRQQQPD